METTGPSGPILAKEYVYKPLIRNEKVLRDIVPGIEYLEVSKDLITPMGRKIVPYVGNMNGSTDLKGGSQVHSTGIIWNDKLEGAFPSVINGTMMASPNKSIQMLKFSDKLPVGSQFAPEYTPAIINTVFTPLHFMRIGGDGDHYVVSNGINDPGPAPTFQKENTYQGFYPSTS